MTIAIDHAAGRLAKQIDQEIMQLVWDSTVQRFDDWTLVQIPWVKDNDDLFLWNETCAWAVEQFGLPGDRFKTHLEENYINFLFKTKEDAIMMTLKWV